MKGRAGRWQEARDQVADRATASALQHSAPSLPGAQSCNTGPLSCNPTTSSVPAARKLAQRRARQQIEGRLQAAYGRVQELEMQFGHAAPSSYSDSDPECAHPVSESAAAHPVEVFNLYPETESTISITALDTFLQRRNLLSTSGGVFQAWATWTHCTASHRADLHILQLTATSHADCADSGALCEDAYPQEGDVSCQLGDLEDQIPQLPSNVGANLTGSQVRYIVRQEVCYMQSCFAHWLAASRRRDAVTQPMHPMATNLECAVMQSPVDLVYFVTVMAVGSLLQTVQQHLAVHRTNTLMPLPPRHNMSWKFLLVTSAVFSAWQGSVTKDIQVPALRNHVACFFHDFRLTTLAFVIWNALGHARSAGQHVNGPANGQHNGHFDGDTVSTICVTVSAGPVNMSNGNGKGAFTPVTDMDPFAFFTAMEKDSTFPAIDVEHENSTQANILDTLVECEFSTQATILETLDNEFTCGQGEGIPVGTHMWPYPAPNGFIELIYFALRCEFTGLLANTDPFSLTCAQATHIWAALWRILHVAAQRPQLHSFFDRAMRDTEAKDFAQHYALPSSPSDHWWQAEGDYKRGLIALM